MNRRTKTVTTLAAGATLGLATLAAPAIGQVTTNRLANPGADTGNVAGWQGTGWTVGARNTADRYPVTPDPLRPAAEGPSVFAAQTSGAQLTQTVDVTDRATQIDAGNEYFAVGGGFGGALEEPHTASLTVQPRNGSGQATGAATVIGAPTAKDRAFRSALVACKAAPRIPVGTRTLQVTLRAQGPAGASTAMADSLSLATSAGPVVEPAIAPLGGLNPAQGPGCNARNPGKPKEAAKLQVDAAGIISSDQVLRVLAPITARASGPVNVTFQAAGRTDRFTTQVDQTDNRVRFERAISAAQVRLGSGITTLDYPGDADTRPQSVRLRAAVNPARLQALRPTLVDGRLQASGSLTSRAQGVVRVQLVFEPLSLTSTGATKTLQYNARIANGRYALDVKLPEAIRSEIALRQGTLDSYTLFTGFLRNRVRGEMESYQVLGP